MCVPSKYFSTRIKPTLKPFARARASSKVTSPSMRMLARSTGPKPRSCARRRWSTVIGSTPMRWQHTASKASWLSPMITRLSGKGTGVSIRPSPAVIASMAMNSGWMMYCRSAIFSLSRWSWSMSRCRSSWIPM